MHLFLDNCNKKEFKLKIFIKFLSKFLRYKKKSIKLYKKFIKLYNEKFKFKSSPYQFFRFKSKSKKYILRRKKNFKSCKLWKKRAYSAYFVLLVLKLQ
jgi:hypothetical protein